MYIAQSLGYNENLLRKYVKHGATPEPLNLKYTGIYLKLVFSI